MVVGSLIHRKFGLYSILGHHIDLTCVFPALNLIVFDLISTHSPISAQHGNVGGIGRTTSAHIFASLSLCSLV